MKSILLPRHSLLLVLTVASALSLRAADKDGFVPMFNGRDLTGWHQVNCAPETFFVRDNMIITTGIPTGTLRTDRMYENFIIELEWRHMKSGGNSGLFLWGDPITAPGTPFSRGIEVQILDDGYNAKGKNEWFTTQGDLFPIHGATMTPLGRISKNGARAFPTEDRTKSSPEWNHYRVVCTNGTISHSINGKEVTTAKDCIPRKGYLCLESEGSECQFRNLRLKELPSSNPPPEYVAKEYEGFMPLYTGLDLRGWKQDPGHAGHWKPKDWILDYDGKSEAKDKNLWSEKEFGDFVLIADWRFTMKPEKKPLQLILPNGDDALDENGKKKLI
ncbi:MAG: DUF1080 domain-containing protein, partial [Verrucomicrobia bacterium]|nr:DUF1080 domain-containing protein [Verrucomicrobiota bacterium]